MAVLTVHALGEPCPAPVVKATRALQQMTEPGVVEVHVDNEAAVQNLGRMAAGRGLTVTNETLAEGHFVVRIEAGAAQAAEKPSGAPPAERNAAGGVEILTCGTCLNHYGLTERLAVGGVTNMYVIVEKLSNAARILRP